MCSVLTPRARSYTRAALSRLTVECTARTLPPGKCRSVVMFLQPLAQQIVERVNPSIQLEELERDPIT